MVTPPFFLSRSQGIPMPIQTQRLILGQNAHGIHAGIDTVTEWKVDDTESAAVSNSRFRNFPCENPQAAALSAR